MKKYVLILLVLFTSTLFSHVFAQCDLKDVHFSIDPNPTSGAGGCTYVFDMDFKLNNNGGNKTVVIQAWKKLEYPNYWNCTTTGTSTENKSPKAADLRLNGTGPQPFLNIAFDISTLQPILSSAYPGGGVTLGSTYTVSVIPADAQGYLTVKLTGLTVTIPSQNCADGLDIMADVWSSQSEITSQWTPHCVICGNIFGFNYPKLEAFQGCVYQNATVQRTVEGTITNNNTDQIIKILSWNVYRDDDADGYETTDPIVLSSTSTPRTLNPGDTISIKPQTYLGNSGTTKDKRIYLVVTTEGIENRQVLLAPQQQCGTLPISLRNFNANQRNGKVALTWETDLENNNDGFDVQRRLGNGRYESIGFVDSKAPAGTGGAYAYSFDDNLSAANTVAYYRLRQVDLDGKSSYSEIRSIRNGSKQISVSVYPNPSRGTTNVSIPEGSGMMDISLNDLTGKSVQRWNSVNMRSLQLNNLKPGIYMLRINFRESGDQVVERIVVQ